MPKEKIICLSGQYPEPAPLSRNMERAAPGFSIWPCTRWGFPCLVDYSSSGGLLPHLFTLTRTVAFQGFPWAQLRPLAVCSLWHCPSGCLAASLPACISSAAAEELRGIAPCGVRTFLSWFSPGAIFRLSKIVGNLPANRVFRNEQKRMPSRCPACSRRLAGRFRIGSCRQDASSTLTPP